MKKLFSILAVLVMVLAFYFKSNAKVLPVLYHDRIYLNTEHYHIAVCDNAGEECFGVGISIAK
jgi:type II secretory pathway component PulL